MYAHPQSYEHYANLYDRFTVEECRDIIRFFQEIDYKNFGIEPSENDKSLLCKIRLYVYTGQRYTKRAETIQSWIQRDRERDAFVNDTHEPGGIRCKQCGEPMHVTNKELYSLDKPYKVLFFFQCGFCKKRRGIFNNGQEFHAEPVKCKKCHKEVKTTDSRKGNIITSTYKCSFCGEEESETMDLTSQEEPKDPLFEKDREEFCLSEEKGREYVRFMSGLENVSHIFEEQNEREKNHELYDAVAKLEQLTIDQLEKHLSALLEPKEFVKLTFGQPEIDRHVIVPFTVRDVSEKRKGHASELGLQFLLKKNLKPTNWRLMSTGAEYHLGLLSGKLKGYEKEEDLITTIKHD